MHVALTGVSGFIGRAIARHLKAASHTVAGLVRSTSNRGGLGGIVDRFVVGDHADPAAWGPLLDGADCVIHNSLGGDIFRSEPFDLAAHLRSNVVGSIALLHASAPRHFIFISTLAVHHDMRPRWGGLIDEDHPLRPNTVYGAYKAAVEAHLWAEHFGSGRNTCALRPCAVYGIDPKLERSRGHGVITSLRTGQPFRTPGGGKVVHVDDVAAAAVAAVGNPAVAGRPYNLADCYARHADWAKMAAELLGIEADIDFSSPAQPHNSFTKDAARSLGVSLDRGHDGIREHLRQLIAAMG